jgi:probable O-glycosylation ligase (exosortase A-associated)
MRFAIYVTLLFAILPLVLTRPFFGLCVYYVVSLLQPKLLCWRPSFQDAMLVGVPLVVGAIATGVRRLSVDVERDPRTREPRSLSRRLIRSPLFEPSWPLAACAALFAYIAVTRLVVPYPLANNSYQFRSLCKVLVVVVLMTGLASDLRRFRVLYIVVALSTAFWAIKGGLKVILLGPHQVYGKTYDNNLFALTSVMTLPMVFYFALSVKHTRWRSVLLVFSALICLAVIGSRSRAGFVALAFVLLCLAWSSRYRLRALLAASMLSIVAMTLSGAEIRDRVDSILAYQQDKSASSRFYTWEVAMRLLEDNPLLGVGFSNFELAKDVTIGGRKAAHNIYLQNLAELGLLGHPLWLAVIFGSIVSLYLFMRRSRRLPADMRWAYYWSRGLVLGLLAFCIHGAFHNEEYLELLFVLVGLGVALQAATRRELRARRLTEMVEEAEDRRRAAAPARRKKRPRPNFHPGRLLPVGGAPRPAGAAG